jgi:hypothetical protein
MNKIILKTSISIGLAFALFLASNGVQASTYHGTLTNGNTNTLTGNLGGDNLNAFLASPPIATPGPSNYDSAQSVTLTASGATSIYYTTDGITTPSCSTGNLYSGAISVSSSLEIQAISCYTGNASSTVASYLYAINQAAAGGGTNYSTATNYGGGGGGGSYSSGGGSSGGTTVGMADFVLLMANWGQTGANNAADFNHDNVVGIQDFIWLMANWTK